MFKYAKKDIIDLEEKYLAVGILLSVSNEM
jgi:hypothetical protein